MPSRSRRFVSIDGEEGDKERWSWILKYLVEHYAVNGSKFGVYAHEPIYCWVTGVEVETAENSDILSEEKS